MARAGGRTQLRKAAAEPVCLGGLINSQGWRQKAGPDDFSRPSGVQYFHHKCQGPASLEACGASPPSPGARAS